MKIEFIQCRKFDGSCWEKFFVEELDEYCVSEQKPSDRTFYGTREYLCENVPIDTVFSFHGFTVATDQEDEREDSHYSFGICKVTERDRRVLHGDGGGKIIGSFYPIVIVYTPELVVQLMVKWRKAKVKTEVIARSYIKDVGL